MLKLHEIGMLLGFVAIEVFVGNAALGIRGPQLMLPTLATLVLGSSWIFRKDSMGQLLWRASGVLIAGLVVGLLLRLAIDYEHELSQTNGFSKPYAAVAFAGLFASLLVPTIYGILHYFSSDGKKVGVQKTLEWTLTEIGVAGVLWVIGLVLSYTAWVISGSEELAVIAWMAHYVNVPLHFTVRRPSAPRP